MNFIRRNLDEGLKSEYLMVEDPLALWKSLRNKYSHQKMVILPRAHYEWTHLRIQDFKLVAEYNSAMFRISSQMKLYGETITEVPRHNSSPSFKNANHHKGKAHMNNALRNSEGACHRCGGNGYWACTCRTLKYLVDLYQASLKEKGVEINFLDQARLMDIPDTVLSLSGQLNTTHLDDSDFIVERGNEVYWSD
ncbi:unnamed protein product [Malus baccata var. baccata]